MREEVGYTDDKPLERETLLAALQTREEFLSGILGSLESFATVDRDWRVTFANAGAQRTTGLDEGELLGRDIREFARTAFPGLDLTALERVMRERETAEFEAETASGREVFHLAVSPLADGGLAVYARDVTERRRAEEQRDRHLQEAEQEHLRLQVVLDSVPAALWIVDGAGKMVYVNDQARTVWGGQAPAAGNVEDYAVYKAWPPGTDELVAPQQMPLARALRGETVAALELEYERFDGSRGTQLAWARPMRSGDAITGAIAVVQDITERKRAEQALGESEERFRGVFESETIAIALGDLDGKLVAANQAFADLLGYSCGELLGKESVALTHPADLERELPLIEEMRASGRSSYRIEKRFVRKDGSFVWTELETGVLRDADGAPEYGIAFVRDTSGRRETELRLCESEERYRTMVETAGEGILLTDPDGCVRFANRRMGEMLGCPSEELLERSITEFSFDDRPPVVLDARSKLPNGGMTGDARFRRIDGSELWTRWNATALRDQAGEHTGNLTMHTDVTEHRRAEQAARESQERLQLATEAAGVGAFDWDIRTGVNVWTPELEAMYGLAPGEFGKTQPAWEQLVHEEDRPVAVALVERALETGLPVEGQWRVVWRDGSVHWISGRFQTLKDEAGSPVRLIGVNVDVTELVEAQWAQRASEERLQIATEATGLGVHDYDVRAGLITWDERICAMWGVPPDEQVTYETFMGGIHPDDRGRIQAAVDAALDPRGTRHFRETYRVISRDGTRRWVNATGHALFKGDEAVRLVGTTEDVTSRVETQEALRESEERYRAIVELAEEDLAVTSDGTYSFQEKVDKATDRRSRLKRWFPAFAGGARRHKVWVLLAAVVFEFAFLIPLGLTPSSRHVLGLPGSLLALTVVVAAVLAGWQVGLVAALAGGVIFWGTVADFGADSAPATVVLSVLIWVAAALLAGFLTDSLTEQLRLRKSAAVALARAETLREQEAEKAAQEERIRIARNLHDSVTQSLFAATLKAEALTITGDQPPAFANALEDVRRLSRGALAQMRTMLLELRGDPVEEVPLQQLLRHVVEAAESRASVRVILTLDEQLKLTPMIHEAVYRIAQEAINNVVRHAKAENAWVQVRSEGGHVRLVVGDDGRGFDPVSVGQGHFGLAFMRERAKETGGGLLITSSVGEGTVVSADWPGL